MMYEPLPIPDPANLVTVSQLPEGVDLPMEMSYPALRDLEART